MTTRKGILSVALAATAVACVPPANVALLNPSSRFATVACPSALIIYADAAKAPLGYQEIAIMTGGGRDQGAIDALRIPASEVGATGIILGGTTGAAFRGTSMSPDQNAVAIYSPSDTAKATATCTSANREVLRRSFLADAVELRNASSLAEPWIHHAKLLAVDDSTLTLGVDALRKVLPISSVLRVSLETANDGVLRPVIFMKH